jgi:hypothetical protein
VPEISLADDSEEDELSNLDQEEINEELMGEWGEK